MISIYKSVSCPVLVLLLLLNSNSRLLIAMCVKFGRKKLTSDIIKDKSQELN